ncbi:MAG: dihydrolipoamide acetyltransferase [Deltaproteobacteria bacterium]|nr:MAG: dihydrolipoamide acetyltransferase [Deltaproteobacteria bacterium]
MFGTPLRSGWVMLALVLAATAFARQADVRPSQPGNGDQQQPQAANQATAETSAPAAHAGTEGDRKPGASSSQVSYELKLKALEERVNQLKEKIFRTKARIMQMQEAVVTGSIGAGSRLILVHRNEMGGAFKLTSVQYALDSQPIFKKVDVDGSLDNAEEIEIYNANIVPGNHNIAVQMVFQGQGYGFFSYVKGYRFKVKSSYTFTAEEGKITTIKIVGFERGGIATPLEERPAIRYDIKIEKLSPEKAKTLQRKAEEAS